MLSLDHIGSLKPLAFFLIRRTVFLFGDLIGFPLSENLFYSLLLFLKICLVHFAIKRKQTISFALH